MCLLLWALDYHQKYKFIFAGNRDEYLARPTAVASWWHPDILSGRDLLNPDHGTWLGINRNTGRFAAITNYKEHVQSPKINGTTHETANQGLISRGTLIKNILLSKIPLIQFMNDQVVNFAQTYGGFNIITVDLNSNIKEFNDPALNESRVVYFANRRKIKLQSLDSGKIYGLSNSILEDPWPKVKLGKKKLQSLLENWDQRLLSPNDHSADAENELIEQLFQLLSSTESLKPISIESADMHPDLPFTIRIPEFQTSKGASYATRTSTVMLVDYQNRAVFAERTLFDDQEKVLDSENTRIFGFKLGEFE
ncbi:hypothetical protein G9A89_003072 [Geosiphon pyriformis]|nr:hypothetical protein G9A89_003072 [Geosiphon pyriformis]